MVTTRAQARKNYKEPDSNDEFGTPPPTSKKRRTRKNVSDNASKDTKSKATEPKDTKCRVTKSKATKSKATSKATESKATESRVTRSKTAKSKATESEATEPTATEPKARKPKATRCKVTKTSNLNPKGTKSKVTKPNSDRRRRRRRSPSAVLRSNPDATFSRLPSEICSLICEEAARAVYKPIPGVSYASWRTHEYDSGIAHVNHRMREIAPQTLAALDRSEKAIIWLKFYDISHLPRLLHLIAEAYSLSNIWVVDPFMPDNRPDWQRAQESYTFTTGSSIEQYLTPRLYAHVYRRLAHGPNSSKLDSIRRKKFCHFPSGSALYPKDALDDDAMHALRAFVERIIERMRYPRHARGELEVHLILTDLTDPNWRVLDWSALNDPDPNRKQLLRVLHQLRKDFSEEIRVNFVIVDSQNPDVVPDFDRLWRETIDEYRRLLTSDWWDDEPFEVEFVKMSPEEADEVYSWEQEDE